MKAFSHAGPSLGEKEGFSGCPAPPLVCDLPDRKKIYSIWSDDKPASVYCSDTQSNDPVVLCYDPHSPGTPCSGTCSSLEPSFPHTLRKNISEAS